MKPSKINELAEDRCPNPPNSGSKPLNLGYVIFHDTTLEAMAEQQPLTREEFAALPGVGEKKLERYAATFIEVIEGHA